MIFARRAFLKAAGLGLVAPACGVIGFDVNQDVPAQTVMGSPIAALLPVTLFQLPLTLDIQAQTMAMGTGPASSAHLKSFALTVTAPKGATFDFLSELGIDVVAEGLPMRLVATLKPVPRGQGSIALGVDEGVDILPY